MSKPADVAIKEIMNKVAALITDPAARKRILDKAAVKLAALVAVYPPEGAWNKYPGARNDGRWYQRGFGARWMSKGGSIGGTPHFRGVGGINNSQDLQQSWQIASRDEYTTSVFTGVTYAPYLLDPAQRVRWAAEHGWKSTDEIGDEFAPIFEDTALEEIDSQIGKI